MTRAQEIAGEDGFEGRLERTKEVRVDLPEALVREARSRMALEELTWERLIETLLRAWVDQGRVGR